MAQRRWIWAVLLALAVAGFYGALSRDHALIYDDEQLILSEATPRSLRELGRAFVEPHYGSLPYYRPLSRVTYLAQKSIHGDRPTPYHLMNAALIGILALTAHGLFRSPVLRLDSRTALWVTAAWVLHPLASSCVFPVAGRETLIPAIWILLTMTAVLREGRGWRWLAPFGLAAALFSKEQAAMLPLLWVWADITGLAARPRRTVSRILGWSAVVLVILAYLAIRGTVLDGASPVFTWLDRPAAPFLSILYGLQSTLAPTLELIYEPPFVSWFSWIRSSCAVALAALAIRLLSAKGGNHRRLAFWVGWFVIAQLPSANFFEQETPFDERYVFTAGVGLLALGGMLLDATGRQWRQTAWVGAGLLLIVLVSVSGWRAGVFRDSLIFHEQWVHTNPTAPNGHNGLGVAKARLGRLDEAVVHYRRTLEVKPDHEQAHNNLGVALTEQGHGAEAALHFEQALAHKSDYAQAHYNLANLHAAEGRLDEAATHYRQALSIEPLYVKAHNNYAALLVRQGNTHRALAQFERVIALDPTHVRAHLNRGILLGRQGDYAGAITSYRRALQLDPSYPEAHFNLGLAAHRGGDVGLALRHLRRAVELRPDWPQALDRQARVLATAPGPEHRDGPEAVRLAVRACNLTQNRIPRFLDTLAAAQAEVGHFATALETAARAVSAARSVDDVEFAEAIEARMRLYRAGQPLRE